MVRRHATVLGAALALALAAGPARADTPYWGLVADCTQQNRIVLNLTCTQSLDCVNKTTALFGCGGPCKGPHPWPKPVVWTDVVCTCQCMSNSVSFGCKDAPTCPKGDTYKCTWTATATLAIGCHEAGYEDICTAAKCPGPVVGPKPTDHACAGLSLGGGTSCFKGGAPGDSGGAGTDGGGTGADGGGTGSEGGDDSGCSMAPGASGSPALALLLLVTAAGALIRRRRS